LLLGTAWSQQILAKPEAKRKCPFGFGSSSKDEPQAKEQPRQLFATDGEDTAATTAIEYPAQLFTCKAGAVASTDSAAFGAADYERIVTAVIAAYDAAAEGQARTDFAACTLRLAGHDLMDY